MYRNTKIAIAAVAVVGGGFSYLACDSDSQKSPNAADRMARIVDESAPRSVDSQQIVDAYRRNAIDADHDYRGRVVRMKVVVDEITQDRDGVPFVALHAKHGDHESEDVVCTFPDRRDDVRGLRHGDEIVVRGYVMGEFAGQPALGACRVEQRNWQDPPRPHSAFEVPLPKPPPPPPPDPGVDAWTWNAQLNPALKKAGVTYKLTWLGNGELLIESKQCDTAKAAVDSIGKTPHGYTVLCVLPDDLPSKALWRESNLW